MRPRSFVSAVAESDQSRSRPQAVAAENYECVSCGTQWGYQQVHNTARCPACGGGLVRESGTETAA